MNSLGSAVLDVLIGEYIENVDQRRLELDVLNGHLLLHDLRIKPSAFQKLQLPVEHERLGRGRRERRRRERRGRRGGAEAGLREGEERAGDEAAQHIHIHMCWRRGD